MVVGSTIFSQNRAVFPPFNSKRLNANLNDDDAKETMENLDIYIYVCVFRHKLPCLSRELVGNMGNHWKPYCNWFCSDRLPEVEQPNTHLAHRLPSVVRRDPGILICLRLHLVGPRCGYDMFLVICNCHWWVRLWEPGGRFMRFMIDYAPMSHYFTGNTTTMGVTIGFVHMLELSHGGTVWRWPGDQMWRMGPNPKSIGIFMGMVSTNLTHLWWNWGWLMIGFTTLEIISLKSHRTPKMFGDMMMMMIIIIITENLFLAIFWAFHMSAGRRGFVFSN